MIIAITASWACWFESSSGHKWLIHPQTSPFVLIDTKKTPKNPLFYGWIFYVCVLTSYALDSNFKIRNFIEVEIEGRVLDLHNNFDFTGYEIDKISNDINLYFEKSDGDWVSADEVNKLIFTLQNVHYLKTIAPNQELISDDNCLAGITYFYQEDREENYGLLDKELPGPQDDIIFTFESERVIRANCENVTLTVS
jgi:hypothetical protein